MARFYGASLGIPTEGGGSGTSVVALVSGADAGFWTDVPDAKFVYYNGYTYFAWIENTSGDAMVASYHHATGIVSTPVLLHAAVGGSAGSPDNHDSPSLLVRSSDHKLVVAYSPHFGSSLWVRISTTSLTTDPTMADGFGAENDVGAANQAAQPGLYTYCSLIELTGEAAIYLWWRRKANGTNLFRQGYAKSTDNGATWATYINVWGGDNTTWHLNYRRIATNGVDRMDLFLTENDRLLANPSHLYHIYWDGTGTWKKSDGTDTGLTTGIFPASATLVKDTADGPAAPLSCGYDGTGKPVTLLLTYDATEATIWQARWTGSAWSLVAIGTTGGLLGGGPFGICAALDRDDVDTVWFPHLVAGKFEMFRWESPDSGATWASTQITSGSAFDNASPDAIWDHASDLKIIWAYGDLGSSFTFDAAAIRGGY